MALIILLASALFSDMHLKGFINHDVKLTVADKSCVTCDFRYLFGINAQFSQLISLIFYPALRHKPGTSSSFEEPSPTFDSITLDIYVVFVAETFL